MSEKEKFLRSVKDKKLSLDFFNCRLTERRKDKQKKDCFYSHTIKMNSFIVPFKKVY